MNARERVRAALERRPVDRMPVDLWHTPEIVQALRQRFGVSDDFAMWKAMDLDKIVWVFMDYLTDEGESAGAQVGAQTSGSRTMWGVPLRDVEAGAAHYLEFASAPLTDDYLSAPARYPFWPHADRFDYETALALATRASRDYAVIGPWVSLFEIYCQLRGLEQALMDLVERPAFVDAVLDQVEAIQSQMMRRFFARASGLLDLVFVSDDIAGQTGLLMSPAMWRRHIRPRLQRWCRLIHEHGLRVLYHTDGAAGELLGPIIDCGVDVLNPIQHACPGMELETLRRLYGQRVVFHGGVDNQFALPRGTVEDVRRETRHCLQTLGADRTGYICCSCHNVQPGTPLENILAMVETVQSWR
jgi:uroporphyrinogen decarboxylase